MAVPPVLSGLRHPERSQRERTRREDRHFKFYEIPDNLPTRSQRSKADRQRGPKRHSGRAEEPDRRLVAAIGRR
jgi:hypothetical protein